MTKIFLVGVQDWERAGIEGKSYIGYLSSGKPIKFTSTLDYVVYPGEVEFDPSRAQEIMLITKMFGSVVKYQDGKSEWPEKSTPEF